MVVAILGTVVTLLVGFAGWITVQLSRTQTALLEMNEVLSTGVVSLAKEMIEMNEDLKGIEEDMSKHIRELAVKTEEDNAQLTQYILDVSAEFRKDFLNREHKITLTLKKMEELIKS